MKVRLQISALDKALNEQTLGIAGEFAGIIDAMNPSGETFALERCQSDDGRATRIRLRGQGLDRRGRAR